MQRKHPYLPALLLGANLLLVLAGQVWPAAAAQPTGTGGAQAPRPTCGLAWRVVPSPNVGAGNNRLLGVAAVTAKDVWAVGSDSIVHWDGISWSAVPTPTVGSLSRIAGVGAGDLWAVGSYNNGSVAQTLIERYSDPCVGGTPTATPVAGSPTRSPAPTRTAPATPSPTCVVPGGYRILLAYADSTPPTTLRANLLAQPRVGTVDRFDAGAGTPSLALMQQYDLVLTYSAVPYQDPNTLGDNLADYEDGGGIVFASYASFWIGQPGYRILGRWAVGAYTPFSVASPAPNSTPVTLGAYDPTDPLMQGVTALNASLRILALPFPTATVVARYSDGSFAVAHKLQNGHMAVGLLAYLGDGTGAATGDYPRLIDNSLMWLHPLPPCAGPTGTATPPSSTPTRSATPVVSPTSNPTGTATPPATACPLQFADVTPNDPFYTYIRCLACRSILSGYSTSPPCVGGTPCFQGGAGITRGQVAKIVANAAGFSDALPSTQQTFNDVPYGSPFWLYVERAALHGVISGYSTSPPCPGGVPCFLPGATLTRGQLAKIDANAAGFAESILSTQQTFADVPYGSAFWLYIERAVLHNVISGYSTSPPCPGGVPCFLPGNPVTRAQTAKIIANSFFPACQTPLRH